MGDWEMRRQPKKINVIVQKHGEGKVYYVRANNGLTMDEKRKNQNRHKIQKKKNKNKQYSNNKNVAHCGEFLFAFIKLPH